MIFGFKLDPKRLHLDGNLAWPSSESYQDRVTLRKRHLKHRSRAIFLDFIFKLGVESHVSLRFA